MENLENVDNSQDNALAQIEKGHSKETFIKSSALGFFVGLAIIVPGVSGSAIAIIFKLYNQLLTALSNLFKKFKQCFKFLLPIIIGAVVGLLVGFVTVKQLLNLLPFATILLFVGLMAGAFPSIKDEISNTKPNAKRWGLLIVGILVPILITTLSLTFNNGQTLTSENLVNSFNVGYALLYLLFGYVVAITQVVPGLSATAILMAFGYFKPLFNSVSLSFWRANPTIFIIYLCLIVGFVLGLLSFSKFLTFLFSIAKTSTMYCIVGLSLGSIASMLISADMIAIYKSWRNFTLWNGLDLALGIILLIVGFATALWLVKLERNKNKK